jgi:hypothetical protein
MSALLIKRGDTKIKFRYQNPAIDGVPLTAGDLSGCTVSFVWKGKADDGTQVALKKAAVITSTPEFQYGDPVDADVVAKDGKFKLEWEVVFPGGRPLTFPNGAYESVQVLQDLG